MKWQPYYTTDRRGIRHKETRAIKSGDGRYSICRITLRDMDRYELWERGKFVSSHDTAQEAKEAADEREGQ